MRHLSLLFLVALPAAAQTQGLCRFPCAHGDRVVFSCEGDLWEAPLDGGEARRLTSAPGKEQHAAYSPDGKWLAFTADYDGSSDVYVMPSRGGEPRRLTWSPDAERVIGWDREGQVLFRARGDLPFGRWTAWRVAPSGGDPVKVALAEAMQVSFAADGRCAFVMWMWENQHWKRYSGGLAADIWVGDVEKKTFTRLTDWKGNDAYPMWQGDRVFYLADRDGVQNIWSSKPDGSGLTQHTKHAVYDVRFPALSDGKIAYQLGGDIRVFDCASAEDRAVNVKLPSDRLQARARLAEPASNIERFGLSPDGTRLVAGARGDVFTIPFKEGRLIDLTNTPAARERSAAWSPDGKLVACLSDATGEYEIWLLDPTQAQPARQLTKNGKDWKLPPVWSPDSAKLAYADMEGRLWTLDAATGAAKQVDACGTWEISTYSWSPDSRFLAYDFPSETWNGTIKVHDTKEGRTEVVTDSRWNSYSPSWDPEGKFLAFLSARTINPKSGDYTFEYNFGIDETVKPYLLRLTAAARASFEPREGGLVTEEKEEEEEKDGDGEEKKKKKKKNGGSGKPEPPPPVTVEWDGLFERCVVAPVPAGICRDLVYAKDRLLWIASRNKGWASGDEDEATSLVALELKSKKKHVVAKGATAFAVSGDGERIVVRVGDAFTRLDTSADSLPTGPDATFRTAGWTVPIDPAQEWRQIWNEVWRLERDFFYDPKLHHVDWEAARKKYEPLLPRVSSREELNDLIGEMIAELSNSHAYISGGDDRAAKPVRVGSLGARLEPDAAAGRYRVARILRGDVFDPKRTSPLIAAGVIEGEFLFAVDGSPVKAGEGWQRLLVDKAEKPVLLRFGRKPDGSDARDVYVVALGGDGALVYADWVEKTRRYVDEKSGGKVGYVHVPDMGGRGLVEFGRQFPWQSQKDALVVDVRWNSGGNTHGMILERLRRSTTHFDKPRHFRPEPVYWRSVRGHLVALMNHGTASDGENFVHAWQHDNLGPVIGTRSWGGLVGYRGDKNLVDGGFNAQPEFAHYGWDGKWVVEGDGAIPGIEVLNDPKSLGDGREPQLDRAIEEALSRIAKEPRTPPASPEPPDRSK
ncbi:MAG: tricorn [Planctomycetota bacterium]|nr:MAG: tricorn [Planctomycetota bacterium]